MDPKAQQLYNEIQSLLNMAFSRFNDFATLYNQNKNRVEELSGHLKKTEEQLAIRSAQVEELRAQLNGQGATDKPETDKLLTTPDGGES